MMNLKKFFGFGLVALTLLAVGCKNDKKAPVEEFILRPASMVYTHEDSTAINTLVEQFREKLIAQDLESCADLLYIFHNDSVFPLTAAQRQDYVAGMKIFHIYDARQNSLLLRSDRNNEVEVLVQIMKDGDLDQQKGITRLKLNPVLFEGQWYLTLLDKYAEGVEEIYK